MAAEQSAAAHSRAPGSPCCRAGSFATVVNDGCMTPWDVIKQRMQVRAPGLALRSRSEAGRFACWAQLAPYATAPSCPHRTPLVCRCGTRPIAASRTAQCEDGRLRPSAAAVPLLPPPLLRSPTPLGPSIHPMPASLYLYSETWQTEGLRAFYKSYWTTVRVHARAGRGGAQRCTGRHSLQPPPSKEDLAPGPAPPAAPAPFPHAYTHNRRQLVMNVPYTALHFAIYESAKKAMVAEGWAGSGARCSDGEDEGLVVQVRRRCCRRRCPHHHHHHKRARTHTHVQRHTVALTGNTLLPRAKHCLRTWPPPACGRRSWWRVAWRAGCRRRPPRR